MLHTLPPDSPARIEVLGLIIRAVEADQRHVGFVYFPDENTPLMVCDLQWHRILNYEQYSPVKNGRTWVESNLDRTTKKGIVALVENIAKTNSPSLIPYSFSDFENCFDPVTGEYLKTDSGDGLTCATFVLAVFNTLGIPFIRSDTWAARPDDVAWQTSMIDKMAFHGCPKEHTDAAREWIGSFRYRPEEVAGAFSLPRAEWAVDQANAMAAADMILEELAAAP